MVNGTSTLSNDDAAQEDELRIILAELRNLIQSVADENKQLVDIVRYYGYEDWKTLTLLDRGNKARQAYEKVMGGRFTCQLQ